MLGLELLHVLKAVVDEAEPRALAATVVGPEAEERHHRRVRHTELLLPEKKAGETRGQGVVRCRAWAHTPWQEKKRNKAFVKEKAQRDRGRGKVSIRVQMIRQRLMKKTKINTSSHWRFEQLRTRYELHSIRKYATPNQR